MSGLEGLLAGHVLVKRYRIREVVGRGGFAVVYRADDLRLQRPVAVKIISIGASDPETRAHLRERFQREARAAAALPHHPSLVTIHDYGTDAETDIDFLAMELLRGQDLAAYLAEYGQPPVELGVFVLRAAAEGLAVGHRAGLIHRDVKPGNIFLAEPHDNEPFRVCVLDFGIARALAEDGTLTRAGGAIPLSPRYASPEQRRGEAALTPASDVFSLGVVGYQLLTGARPFEDEATAGETPFVPLRQRNPGISPELEGVIHRALASDPAARFPDADAFVDALEAAVGEVTRMIPTVVAEPDEDERTVLQPTDAVPAAAAAGAGAAAGYAAASPPPPPRVETPAFPPKVVPSATAPRRGGFRWVPVLLVLALVGAAAVWAMGRGGNGAEASERPAATQPAEPPA
ncbi:MAG TPA: serine/threonine-protein kinase, partial [Longimicrobium sp.]|nr:serine/threonine-protein kinase [Longimicrobium sp.]